MERHIPTIGLDLDGTVLDTAGLFQTACIDTFAHHNFPITVAQFKEFCGRGLRSVQWFEALGVEDPTVRQSMLFMRDAMLVALLESEAKWIEGAPESLEAIRRRQDSLIVVTNSQEIFLNAIRRRLPEIDDIVTDIVTSDRTGIRPKPCSSGIEYAMKQSNTPPDRFLYTGDQLFDRLAAQKAGVHFCALNQHHSHPEAIEGADYVITHMKELPEIRLDQAV